MNKRRLIISLFSGIIALNVATLSMSIAWYASATRLYVESIEIAIDGDRELLISTQPDADFKEHLDQNDVHHVAYFKPLTTSHSDNWLKEKSDTPIFYDESFSSDAEDAILRRPATEGYFSQKFYLYSDDDIYVTINPDNTFIRTNAWNDTYANTLHTEYQQKYGNVSDENLTEEEKFLKHLSYDQIHARLDELCNAMRFSVLVTDPDRYSYTIINPNKDGDTYLGGVLDNDVDRYYDSYYKESDHTYYERVYGEIVGDKNNIVYDEPDTIEGDFERANEEPSAFNAKHKVGVKKFNLEQSRANGVDFKKEESYSLNDFRANTVPYRIPVYRDKPQEIVISIYIEGWDEKSINYTMGAGFESSLCFKIEREMGGNLL